MEIKTLGLSEKDKTAKLMESTCKKERFILNITQQINKIIIIKLCAMKAVNEIMRYSISDSTLFRMIISVLSEEVTFLMRLEHY
jgi:hypothetical protein